METFCVRVTEEGRKALDRVAAFNPETPKREILSRLCVEAAKQYKGRKPPKVAPAKKAKA